MKRTHLFGLILGTWFIAASVFAAELGRQAVGASTSEGGLEIDTGTTYTDVMSDGVAGVELDLVWNAADWDVGSDSNDDKVWMPQFSLYYGVSDFMDIRLCVKYLPLEDGADDLDLVRVGIGTKAWLSTGGNFTPYVGVLVHYYTLSSDSVSDIEGTFGISGEAGVAFLLTDTLLVRVGFQGERFLADAEGGSGEDIAFSAVGLGIGATVLF